MGSIEEMIGSFPLMQQLSWPRTHLRERKRSPAAKNKRSGERERTGVCVEERVLGAVTQRLKREMAAVKGRCCSAH